MHVFFLQDEALAHADAIVIGEAEYAWNDLLDDFSPGDCRGAIVLQRCMIWPACPARGSIC